jgi:hypothetical protein
MMPADLSHFLDHKPPPVIAAYCMAWHTDKALWLSAWTPGERASVRLVMRRVCRG